MKTSHLVLAAFALASAAGATWSSPTAAPAVLAINSPTPSRTAVDNRWESSFAAFAAADKVKAPATGGIVFVGSSSIRMWEDLEQDFRAQPVIVKRGFGGSRMLDCAEHLQRLVVPYQPRMVVVYAGDNDLAEGRTPSDVRDSFAAFVEGVRRELPNTRIAYVSIKPSPSRQHLMPQIREANAMISSYVAATENADFIDIFTPMLTDAGEPRAELFTADNLHMNDTGYDLWQKVIAAHLE